MVEHCLAWLDAGVADKEAHMLLDLPDTGWLVVDALTRVEDLIRLTGHGQGSFGQQGEQFQIVCGPDAVKAIRFKETWGAGMARIANLVLDNVDA